MSLTLEAIEAVMTIHERIARDKRDEERRRWVVAELNTSELVRANADELLAFIEESGNA
jgi:putative SOS response-associated peptidase YedK